ncbi:MAG TPA: hypothetical protein P5230_02730 [Candidatus Magasanikbacteria bacterium]|nr:hypothetical protein [Candidatus Magasanikbacteria bacterium]
MQDGDKSDSVKVSKDECKKGDSCEVDGIYEFTPVFFTNEDPGVDKFINYQKKFFEKNFSKL